MLLERVVMSKIRHLKFGKVAFKDGTVCLVRDIFDEVNVSPAEKGNEDTYLSILHSF